MDNLKLGYGGTKTEMQRLIKDAAKMKDIQKKLGIEVDATSMSYGNIVKAIHVMQEQMYIVEYKKNPLLRHSQEEITLVLGDILILILHMQY